MSINGWSPIWICTLLFFGVSAFSFSAKQGFHDKFMNAKHQLTNNFYLNSGDKNNLKIEADMLWSTPLKMQPNYNIVPTIMETNNHTLLLNNLDLWVFKNEALHLVISLERKFNHDVQLAKVFEWQDRLFLLVCFQNSICNLYSSSSDFNFSYYQPIFGGGVPTDAQFFVQQGKLFLTIIFQAFNSYVSKLRLYQWHNLVMDDEELIPVIVSTASSITLFAYGEDIVIVLGCFGENILKYPSQVWKRKKDGEMTKVQYLTTDSPISITHFVERGENFILILERDCESTIYWWEGSEFVRWLSTGDMMKYSKVAVSSRLKYTTFFIFTQRNFLRIYLMTSVELDRIYEKEFSSDDMTGVISILSATVFEENSNSYLLVLTKSQRQIYVSLLRISIQILYTGASEGPNTEVHQSDTTQERLDTIYTEVRLLKGQMDVLKPLSSSVLLINKDVNISGVVRVSQEVYIEGGEIHTHIMYSRMDIVGRIHSLHKFVEAINEEINLYTDKLQTTPLNENRHLVFNGDVKVNKLKLNSVIATTVNKNSFEPRSLLSVTNKQQRLQSVKAKKLKVTWLAVRNIGEKTVKDFLVADSRVKVPVTVAGLETRNLRLSEDVMINNITAKDLTKGMVTVESGENSFNKISQIGAGESREKPRTLLLQNDTVIQNLNVDLIDNVSINHLLSLVFVQEINNIIHGNVHFKVGVVTQQLTARKFDHIVEYSPPQSVYPQMVPLYMLYPLPPPQYWRQLNPMEQDMRRNKRDNSEENERTIRKRRVKIIGDLKVARVVFRNSSMVVNNLSVPTDNLENTFWTSKTPQEVDGSVHFAQGISIGSSLKSPIVSGYNLTSYATRRSSFNSLILKNIHVGGNMTSGENAPLWMQSKQTKGTVFKVLNVKRLQAKNINGEKSQNILQTRDLQGRGISVMTETLKVKGDLEADLINDIDVKHKFESAVITDRSFALNKVEFKNISGDNIKMKNLNNHSLEYLMGFSSRENLSVFIHGDVHVSQLDNISTVNNYPADFSKVVNKRKGATIYGKKKFNAQVKITNEVKISTMNNIHFESFVTKILRISSDQNITGFYTIRNAKMKSVFNVNEINGVDLSKFIYTSQPQVSLPNNVRFKTIAVDGNMTSATLHRSCQLPKVENEVVFEKASEWTTVHISGDSTWPKGGKGRLQHLFDFAVRSYDNQTIAGDVTIKLLSLQNIIVQSFNGKNISLIFQDTLSRMKQNQVITGRKRFLDTFRCRNIEVKGDANVKSINNIKINEINDKIVRRTGDEKEAVSGHKTFLNGFRTFSLKCLEGINGVKAENIIGRNFQGIAPPLFVQSLKVFGPLQVKTIDDLHLNSFLQDCIYLENPFKQLIKGEIHIVGNVTIQGVVSTSSINNISTNDIVFVNRKKESVKINGCKRFLSPIEIETDPNIDTLNGRNLTETYRENLKIDQNATINGSVMIISEVEVDTIYAREYFVGSKKLTYLNKTFPP